MVNPIPVSTYSLVVVAIIPFIVIFGLRYWRFRPLLRLEHTLLKLSPTTGKTRAFTLMPLNLKEEYVEVPRADGTIELLNYNGQASMVIETKHGFEYFYVNPIGPTRILSPPDCARSTFCGAFASFALSSLWKLCSCNDVHVAFVLKCSIKKNIKRNGIFRIEIVF